MIGDDIRGFSPFETTEYAPIQTTRQEIDNLVVDLSVRMSTLGYDTEFYLYYNSSETLTFSEYNLTVGCDEITTLDSSSAFVAGDTLTIFGRTFVGSALTDPADQVSDACLLFLPRCCY